MDGRMTIQVTPLPTSAGIARRLASMAYESLLAFSIVFFAGLLFYAAVSNPISGLLRNVFQIYLLSTLGIYFVWCWHRGGQTLPMKTWKLQVISVGGESLSLRLATRRYLLACPSIALAGAGILWAAFDRDRQFLHDRLAGTRIVNFESRRPARAESS